MNELLGTLSRLTILYAEDDDKQREEVGKTLNLLFDKVFIAKDGLDALEIFNSTAEKYPHILFFDYVMPFFSGVDVALQIKLVAPKIPIIIGSAFSDKEKLMRAIDAKVISYIEKPFTEEKLFEALLKAVEKIDLSKIIEVKIGDTCKYDYFSRIFMIGDEKVSLSKQELAILELLLANKGNIVTKEILEEKIFDGFIQDNTLRNIIYRMRKKMRENVIETVQDFGYRIL